MLTRVQTAPGYPSQPWVAGVPAQRRSRRHRPLAFILTLLLALTAMVVADRLVANRVTAGFEQSLTTGADGFTGTGAHVEIHGFPFLTQFVTGNFRHISIELASGSFDGFEVQDVRLEAFDVHTNAPWQAGSVDIDAVISYSALEMALQQALGTAAQISADLNHPGLLVATSQVTVLGFPVPISIEFIPTLVGYNTVRVDVEYVSVAGAQIGVDQIPLGLGAGLDDLQFELPLPSGFSLEAITVLPAGLRVQGHGNDIVLEEFGSN